MLSFGPTSTTSSVPTQPTPDTLKSINQTTHKGRTFALPYCRRIHARGDTCYQLYSSVIKATCAS
jgi:hypothetical protein